ncbi:MAG TPA: hypothetical protein VF928_11865 [Usitatibacteraceae bacterium]
MGASKNLVVPANNLGELTAKVKDNPSLPLWKPKDKDKAKAKTGKK